MSPDPQSRPLTRGTALRDASQRVLPAAPAPTRGTAQDHGPGRSLRVEVVFATRGRAEILRRAVEALDRQTLRPSVLTISGVTAADAGVLARRDDVKILLGEPGLARQRNLALRHLAPETEIVVFFDDDFIAHPGWIEAAERWFRAEPEIAAVTGHVLRDGIKGPGLTAEAAMALLAVPGVDAQEWCRERASPYGCNMAFRRAAIEGLWFDERLVLYGWLEDRDFGGALARRGGRLVQIGAAVGVHLGAKAGRLSGRRLGYSQIVNPLHLARKGTMTMPNLLWHCGKNLASNLALSLRPEPYVDRRGRLAGNAIGLWEVLSGVAAPERAERL